jgi:hypothetical protein
MFGWFQKKKPATLMDQFIVSMYGDSPPQKRADVDAAIQLAHQELLGELVDLREIREIATALYRGPIPYSTHDLALSVALNFFKQPTQIERLKDIEAFATIKARLWLKKEHVAPMIFKTFQETLYRVYRANPEQVRDVNANSSLPRQSASPSTAQGVNHPNERAKPTNIDKVRAQADIRNWVEKIPSAKTLMAIGLVVAGVAFFLSEGYDPKEGMIGSVMDPDFGICFEHHDAQYDYGAYKLNRTVCGSKLPYRRILASLFAVLGFGAIAVRSSQSKSVA